MFAITTDVATLSQICSNQVVVSTIRRHLVFLKRTSHRFANRYHAYFLSKCPTKKQNTRRAWSGNRKRAVTQPKMNRFWSSQSEMRAKYLHFKFQSKNLGLRHAWGCILETKAYFRMPPKIETVCCGNYLCHEISNEVKYLPSTSFTKNQAKRALCAFFSTFFP